MYKRLFIIFGLTVALIFSGAASVNAQQSVQDTQYNQGTGTTTNQPGTGTTTTNEDRGGFDWRWLLPLLAIPIIYWIARSSRDDDRADYRDPGFAGTKGGRARKDTEEEDVL